MNSLNIVLYNSTRNKLHVYKVKKSKLKTMQRVISYEIYINNEFILSYPEQDDVYYLGVL